MVFASDWSGRQFAIDRKNMTEAGPAVSLFDLGAPKSFSVDRAIVDFHDSILIEKTNAALSSKLFESWRTENPADIAPNECIGYKIPLFLGANDKIDNLERIDMDVYLSLCSQLYAETLKLPPGATIRSISIRDRA